ncbi:MAG: PLDc N-terminal domain-containing protein [Pleurocapsa minor GSE-CHR-MK-17-07R]|jgi:ABC-type transport system involved in multi-copper enzyme maturation permease subunit|nr:PLDc N-terminal domain-containing protein [Pleurocapsa minor GSE-CHR-MK 17-07R]
MNRKLISIIVAMLMLVLPMTAFAQDASAAEIGAAIGFSAIWLVCCAAVFILNIVLLVWVYRDAQARGENGALWALIVLVAGIIGLILYFLTARQNPKRPTM